MGIWKPPFHPSCKTTGTFVLPWGEVGWEILNLQEENYKVWGRGGGRPMQASGVAVQDFEDKSEREQLSLAVIEVPPPIHFLASCWDSDTLTP